MVPFSSPCIRQIRLIRGFSPRGLMRVLSGKKEKAGVRATKFRPLEEGTLTTVTRPG